MEHPEIKIEEASPVVEPTPKKHSGWIISGIVLVIFLAGAAFLAGKLLNRPASYAPGKGGMMFNNVQIELTPAPELPTTPPKTTGVFVSRQDNSISIGTGKVVTNASPGSSLRTAFDGPIVEVVMTHDTLIYKDTTDMPEPREGSAAQVVAQVVEPGSLDDLGANTMVTVWGEKQGDRIIAGVIVYR
jgi:hypothetical protein